jgi:hypothetical protein
MLLTICLTPLHCYLSLLQFRRWFTCVQGYHMEFVCWRGLILMGGHWGHLSAGAAPVPDARGPPSSVSRVADLSPQTLEGVHAQASHAGHVPSSWRAFLMSIAVGMLVPLRLLGLFRPQPTGPGRYLSSSAPRVPHLRIDFKYRSECRAISYNTRTRFMCAVLNCDAGL